ncbi:hypothetical protein [Amycolatopsis sp. NPDC051128]|uniref:hypothetical protein n=1 Tax=Amycolatopsis sp. NPDC051128 TaxID=3155412 RepID=UPI003429CDA5
MYSANKGNGVTYVYYMCVKRKTKTKDAVRQELAAQQAEASRSLERATARKTRINDERQKLLQAHYAGAIPQDLLGSEMQRLTRELAQAETEIKTAKVAAAGDEHTT